MFELYDYQQRLVDEARESIANGSKGVLIQSPAGSGKSVVIAEIARLAAEKDNHILFIVHRKELAEQIEETFIKNNVKMENVTIETVMRAWNRRDKLIYPQIIITDETHHSRAKTYRNLYDHYDKAFRLGFTATPWRMSGDGFTDIYDDLIKGESVKWLIENKFLAPYRYFAEEMIDRSHLKKSSTGDFTYKSMEEEFENRRIYGNIVEHYQKHAKGRKTIVYAPSIAISEQIADEFKANGIASAHADGKTPKVERERIMKDFRTGKIQVLVNVDLISEGFNVPDCECVILARPTESLVLFIQQAMRSMRYMPNKEAIILDHVGNVHTHGLPDMDREWTIKDRARKGSNNSEKTLAKQCESCFAWLSPENKVCPFCKFEFKVEMQEIEFEDGELKEIKDTETFVTDYEKIRFEREWRNKSRSELKTASDYVNYAKAHGYKDGWIKFNYKPFKKLNWPQFYIKLKQIKN